MNTKKHNAPEELLASLLADYKKPEDLIGENGLLKQLTKLLVERALDAELTEHLGHERNEAVANPAGNTRNGKSKKTLKGEFGELPIEVPRDRHGSFEPQLIPKHQTRWVEPVRNFVFEAQHDEQEHLCQARRSRRQPAWRRCRRSPKNSLNN